MALTIPGVATETAADDRITGRLADKVAGRRHARGADCDRLRVGTHEGAVPVSAPPRAMEIQAATSGSPVSRTVLSPETM